MKLINGEGQLELKTKQEQEQKRKSNKYIFRYKQQMREPIFTESIF